MSKKKRKKKRISSRDDFHHFFWTKRAWNSGWHKRLRDHPYCGARLPQMTLHRLVHAEMTNIPLPDVKACKNAYLTLEDWLEAGIISLNDSPERKLKNLSECFCQNNPATAKALNKQRRIIVEFSERPLQ